MSSNRICLPRDFRPEPGYIYGSLEAFVDCGPYLLGGDPDFHWCEFSRISPGSAAVFPLKLMVPGRGEGQFKFEEVDGWRYDRYVLEALREADRARGYPLRGPQPAKRSYSAIPPGIDREWLAGVL